MAIDVERLRARMSEMGMSPQATSLAAGLKRDAVRNILRGVSKNARTDTITSLARTLSCSVDYLMGAGGDAQPEVAFVIDPQTIPIAVSYTHLTLPTNREV